MELIDNRQEEYISEKACLNECVWERKKVRERNEKERGTESVRVLCERERARMKELMRDFYWKNFYEKWPRLHQGEKDKKNYNPMWKVKSQKKNSRKTGRKIKISPKWTMWKKIKTHKKENVSPSDQTFKKWIQKWTKKSFGQWQVIEFSVDRIVNWTNF